MRVTINFIGGKSLAMNNVSMATVQQIQSWVESEPTPTLTIPLKGNFQYVLKAGMVTHMEIGDELPPPPPTPDFGTRNG